MSFEVDHLLRAAAISRTSEPLIAYPSSPSHPARYNVHTAADVDRFVSTATLRLSFKDKDIMVSTYTSRPWLS